mmetsp:Transcript_9812/g.29242  ORF Transcript_9812/g.29242 Transcript_9812/m.29242 type:complete len:188 (-) Transcript_9812:258-821(-)
MSRAPAAAASNSSAPNPVAILCSYLFLGSLVSTLAGREPGTLPEDVVRELAPVIVVVCGFIVSYNVWDVMAVGVAKGKYSSDLSYEDIPRRLPEEVYLAQRVQTNQVEQMPGFLVGSLSCAFVVNGKVAAVLSLLWAILRRQYATTYRAAVGVPIGKIGLTKFTIPCYFLMNTMLTATAVHAVRALI